MMGAQFTLAQQYSDAKQEEMTDDFRQKLGLIVSNGHLSLAIALGNELNLFEALAKAGSSVEPASAIDVARVAHVKARYCHEWLCCMACGEIIETDQTGQQFWIADEKLHILTGPNKDRNLMANSMLAMFGVAFNEVANAFRQDGPLGVDYSAYPGFYDNMNNFSIAMHKNHLIKDLVPQMHMQGPLHNGIEVLDVGCGGGFHVLEMAQHYPKSKFIGIDFGAEGVRQAQEDANKKGLKNASFVLANAAELDASWTDKFDLVTIFDACHDQTRPDLAMEEIYRCLKPGGQFSMVEVNGSGNCYVDKMKLGPEVSSFLYANSIFHCLPVGCNSEDALQLGTMWGVDRGKLLLESVGFKNITIEQIPYFDFNVLYKATK
ncbi:methyltransferase domain-containing protein [Ditylenchus destructor]|uniref:Methyltransferase domain-containing protein n=1 Tax=Ditylenchus destructor TaxID=166010 RepID=A0AAD4MQD7_9BILA|nr:methyltransferase domain-containing protein [Ditylenchus destructor]